MSKTIIIYGDVMEDRYTTVTPTKISQEAPVMVVTKDPRNVTRVYPGGAGNAAAWVRMLTKPPTTSLEPPPEAPKVKLVGITGPTNPIYADQPTIVIDPAFGTITKTRLIDSSGAQILRIDEEPPPTRMSDSTKTFLTHHLNQHMHTLLISDYGKGTIFEQAAQIAISNAEFSVVNGKPQNIDCYKNATVLVMNTAEAQALTHSTKDHYEIIKHTPTVRYIVITDGPHAINVYEPDGFRWHLHPPEPTSLIVDITGAGDILCAAITACGHFDRSVLEYAAATVSEHIIRHRTVI